MDVIVFVDYMHIIHVKCVDIIMWYRYESSFAIKHWMWFHLRKLMDF